MSPLNGSGELVNPPPAILHIEEPSPELADVYARVEKGIAWLTEHDPSGAFHLWFESKISPIAPMPAQSDDRRAEYAAYHQARTLFERLWRKMVALENRGRP